MTPQPFTLDRRHFLALGGAVMGGLALSACGGPDTSGGSSASASADIDYSGVKPAASIDYWSVHPGSSKDVETKIVDAFNASQTAIKVNLVTAGATYEDIAAKFQAAQQGGQLPAVVLLSDVWWFRYLLNGTIVPLDGLIKAVGISLDDYRTGLVQDYQYKGKQWAMPYARSTPMFYYNKAHFKAAGLADAAPKTWDDFAAMAPKLMSSNNLQFAYMHPAVSGYDSWTLQNKIWAFGGQLSKEWDITCDGDGVVKALQFNADSVNKGKWAGVSAKNNQDDFAAGAVAATVASTGSLVGVLKTAKFDVGVGFLPGGPAASDNVCPTGGSGHGIPAGISKEQQLAAATFLKFATSPENSVLFSDATGYLPVRKSAVMDAIYAKRPQAKVAVEQLDHTRKQDYARVFLPGGDREIGTASSEILTQGAGVADRLAKLKTSLTTIYTNDVKPKLT